MSAGRLVVAHALIAFVVLGLLACIALERYREKICCFNDDIQGTAVVTLDALLAACRIRKVELSTQKVVVVGAGSAGCGIAEQIIRRMVADGNSDQQARRQIYMVDKSGL